MARPPVGKICVYCADRPATTWDHVFARGFLPKDRRNNLPQAPACERCNSDKSKLENELAPWKEWDLILGSDCSAQAFFLTPTKGEMFFDHAKRMGARQRAEGTLSGGALVFEGARSEENPTLSLWTFSIYGMRVLSADPAEGVSEKIGALTERREFIEKMVDSFSQLDPL